MKKEGIGGAKGAAVSRRSFLAGCFSVGGAAFAGCATGGGAAAAKSGAAASARGAALDPNAIGVISDVHTGMPWSKQKYRTGREYPWQPAASKALVDEILALPNPPANVICLGDLSIAFGEEGDYEIAAEVLKPLSDAGIKVTCAMGNHDIRAEFLKSFPGYDKTTKVPGRFTSVVETPNADFILLDSLKEPTKRGSYPAVTGRELGKEQTEWLKETLTAATRPTFVCAHHIAYELGIEKLCAKTEAVVGYLHGHHHHWMTNYCSEGYADNARTVRMMGFPSFGLDRDVGYGVIRTTPRLATLHCRQRDYYFPTPRPAEERGADWDLHVADWDGRTIGFALS